MKTWVRRHFDEITVGLLVVTTLAFPSCSNGISSSRYLDAATVVPDAPENSATPIDAGTQGNGDSVKKDSVGNDGFGRPDLSAPDLARPDSIVPALPAYQGDGTGFPRVSLDFLASTFGDWFCAVLPLPANQVMLVGTTNTKTFVSTVSPPQNEFTLLRLNGDGKIDTTFGTAGKVHVGMTTHLLDGCKTAALTKEGTIVVVGYGDNDFVVARFLKDGSLDRGFGDGGMATTKFNLTPGDSGQNDRAMSLALLDDGRILVGGEMPLKIAYPQSSRALLARYLPNGDLDPTFGSAGTLVLDLATLGAPANHSLFQVNSLLVEQDGSALVGLTSRSPKGEYALAVLRLNPDGSVATGFATDGVLWETRATLHDYKTLVQLSKNSDGGLVILGRYPNGMFLSRYFANGQLDNRFGVGGRVVTPYEPNGTWQANVLLRPTDGSYLVGLGANPPSSIRGRFGLVRYTVDGVLDEGFGWLSWEWYNEDSLSVAYLTAGALLPNDDIVLAGYITTNHSWNTNSAAMRLKKTNN